MDCYITATGSFLPGSPITNKEIPDYMGELDDEKTTRIKILRMNGIRSRYYALDKEQNPTYDLYQMGAKAVSDCLKSNARHEEITYLSAGSTNTPLTGPGLSTILHDRINADGKIQKPVEINSNSGICSASAQALVNAIRAIRSGEHTGALSVGVEQPSEILKSTVIRPPNDQSYYNDLKQTKWFMSVFLRSMLSDGAGAMQLSSEANAKGLSFKVNWTYSRSFANQTSLCMQLDGKTRLLSQDVRILSKYMKPCVRQVISESFGKFSDNLGSYQYILPHLSSFFFKPYLTSVIKEFCIGSNVDYWTNLANVGNTGAASIYIMLDHFSKTQDINDGDKLLLFIPESGQFNFVLVSLTAKRNS